MEISTLARDIGDRLRRDKPDVTDELVQEVLDVAETLGGFDFSVYEDDDDDDNWDDVLAEDDRWPGDTDDD